MGIELGRAMKAMPAHFPASSDDVQPTVEIRSCSRRGLCKEDRKALLGAAMLIESGLSGNADFRCSQLS